jgi:hypothetical protein
MVGSLKMSAMIMMIIFKLPKCFSDGLASIPWLEDFNLRGA